MKTKYKAKDKSKYYYYFVYYVKLVKHMKCYNSLRMIIFELTAIGQSELGTVTSYAQRGAFRHFSRTMVLLKEDNRSYDFSLIRKTFSWRNVCVTVSDWETIGELTISNDNKKKHSPKAFTARWSPIEYSPYNSSKEIQNTHVWVMFLFSLHMQCTFLYISTYTNVILVLYSSAEQHSVLFCEWISLWTNRVSQWFNDPCFVSIESAVLNESSESVIQRSMFRFYWISRFEWIEWVSDSTIHVSFLLNQPFWMNRVSQWFNNPCFVSIESAVLNESSESVIQRWTLVSFLLNQPFWTNRVSQWFNDPCFVSIESAVLNESSESVIQRSMFRFYWISRFEWIEWVSDSTIHVSFLLNQPFWMNRVSQWFNDPCFVSIESAVLNESSESVIQRSMFRFYWISHFERIEWVSDSTIHVSFLLNQPFWMNRVSQWFNDPCFVSIESAVLNESSEPVIQRSMFRFYWISRFEWIEWVSDSTIHVSFLLNQPFWTNRVSQWFNDEHLFRFYWISRFERIEWVSDSTIHVSFLLNQPFWTNRVSQWFNDEHLFRFYWISRFERIEWVSDSTIHVSFLLNQPFWMNRVSQWFNNPCFVSIESAVLNESSESVIQRWTLVSFLLNQPFWTNRVSQWFNDPCFVSIESAVLNESSESVIQRSMFRFYWISRFERIEWVSDSTMDTCFVSIESAILNESSESVIQRSMFRFYWISHFEWIEWVSDSTIHVSFLLNQPFWMNRVSQWFNDPCFVSIESAVLNESSESVIQRSMFRFYWISRFEWIEWVSDSTIHVSFLLNQPFWMNRVSQWFNDEQTSLQL